MNTCVVCGNDSGKGKTCGGTCRQALSRRKCDNASGVTAGNVTVGAEIRTKGGISVATPLDIEPETGKSVEKHGETLSTDLTASRLYLAIHNYPQDTWKDSPEYKELMLRLHSKDIAELESGGYSVPCWKYSEAR